MQKKIGCNGSPVLGEQQELAPSSKKARSEGSAASSSKEKISAKPQTWQDIKLPGEDEVGHCLN
jgi:hypothetical protein